MSLKAFHIAFVMIATLFSAGFGWWAMHTFITWGGGLMLAMSLASFLLALALIVYGVWFYRKVRRWSYL